ncbi:MAG TPA: LamG-like jellyroll fold domain-containing protein [Ignavibacteriaceae bacterium]|nr:LamG-like jellyroll fold domain-containing protein [Ignavibacteriaceae bacterium]
MKQFFNIFLLFIFISGLALAQENANDNKETLREQAMALAEEQSPSIKPNPPTSILEVTHPLFIAVDDITVPAYFGNPATNEWLQALIGYQFWGAAFDVANNKVYFNNGSTLYEWPVGGTVTQLGTIVDTLGATQSVVGLAFYNGELYAIKNIANEAVYKINTSTLVARVHIDYIDADFDLGGLAIDQNTGIIYATNDDTTPFGSGLFRINTDGTGTLITPYPAGQTDIDGLAISNSGIAYLITDEPGFVYVYDLNTNTYLTPLNNPWTSSEVFSSGTWIYEAGGSGFGLPEILYYLFDETGGTQTTNYAVPGGGFPSAPLVGGMTMGPTGQFNSGLIGAGGTGTTDYVNTGWNMDVGASSWTISLWLNNIGTSAFCYLFGNDITTSFRCFTAGAAGAGNITLRGTGITNVNVTGVLPGPSVVHFVYDATVPEIRTYVNGTFQSAVAQAALNLNAAIPFKVGSYGTAASIPAGALLDEFRFYSRALDAAEVAATWNISVVPVELTSFIASVTGSDVKLLWETASELNNSGFSIERKYSNTEFMEVGFVPGFGTTTEPKSYSFSDQNLRNGVYSYRLKQIDLDGTFTYSDEVEVEVIAPASFSLDQNYPNPFNPSTRISFSLAVDSKVSLKVFDILGQEVASLVNQNLTQGVHTYDFNASGINSGVYFYKIEATGVNGNEFTNVKKMILVK